MTASPSANDRLIVALDVPTVDDARALVAALGDDVTFYKIGLELAFAGGLEFAQALKADGKNVFLDMKLLDIGATVRKAVATACALGVDLLTIHGHDAKTLNAAIEGRGTTSTKLLAVTVLTSLDAADLRQHGTTMTPEALVAHRAELARAAGFDGVVASGQEAAKVRAIVGPDMAIVTPGIRLAGAAADDQARIMTPERAIAAGATHLVVGRPITQAQDPRAAAQVFAKQIASAL